LNLYHGKQLSKTHNLWKLRPSNIVPNGLSVLRRVREQEEFLLPDSSFEELAFIKKKNPHKEVLTSPLPIKKGTT